MRKSLTLIEIVVALVLVAVAFPAVFMLFSHVVETFYENEVVSTAAKVAGCYMEEIRSKRFDEEDYAEYKDDINNLTAPASLGYDSSTNGLDGVTVESSSARNNWDDVDDYNGYSDLYEYDSAYSIEVEVFYVDADTLNIRIEERKFYKHVKVKVSHVSSDIEVEVDTLVTPLVEL